MKASAMCPGSCGELIQGIMDGRELLVSYPVNLYSRVTLIETTRSAICYKPPKVRKALELTFKMLGFPVEETRNIQIEIESDIPSCKGMASSTADIGAVIAAVGCLLEKNISIDLMVDIALKIEPTDSILFEDITLFDPVQGLVRQSLGQLPSMKVIVLEGRGTIDTMEFRKRNYIPVKTKYTDRMEEAFKLLKTGIEKGNCFDIGKAGIISAFANQEILKKEQLKRVVDKTLTWGAVGINVAHSGTVIGVLVDASLKDPEEIMRKIKAERMNIDMTDVYCLDIVQGGVILL